MNKNRLGNKRRRGTVLRKHMTRTLEDVDTTDRPVRVNGSHIDMTDENEDYEGLVLRRSNIRVDTCSRCWFYLNRPARFSEIGVQTIEYSGRPEVSQEE